MKRLAYFVLVALVTVGCTGTDAKRTASAQSHYAASSECMPTDEAVRLALQSDASILSQNKRAYMENDEPIAWRASDREQRFTAVNFNSVRVTDSVRNSNGDWQSVAHQGSTNFSLMQITHGGLDRYALSGLTRDGRLVVELWSLVSAQGTVVVQGASGTSTSPQLVAKTFQKTRIIEGAQGHKPVAIEYDPAGRYVVCAIRDPQGQVSLNRLDPRIPASPLTLLHDSTTIPELNGVQYAQKFDHAQLGRILVFGTAFEAHKRIVLVDADNDGVFDGAPIVGDDAFFEAQGLNRFEDYDSLIE